MLKDLVKLRITMAVAVSCAAGYVLASSRFDFGLLETVLGTFVLACGSAALNHMQDRHYDAKMQRTSNRPLPSGGLSLRQVGLFTWVLCHAGALFLWARAGTTPFLLGLLTMFCYNVLYTYLKRVTSIAVIPGALVGALPPLIGWTAAGGDLLDPRALTLAFFFFIWQIPHFWILVLMHNRDYAGAGYPTLKLLFSEAQITRLTYSWLLGTVAAGCLFHLNGLTSSHLFAGIYLVMSSAMLIFVARKLFQTPQQLMPAFKSVLFFMLAVSAMLIAEPLLG